MSLSQTEVEDRLRRTFRALAAEVPEDPPIPWPGLEATVTAPSPWMHRLVGAAASIVLIVMATVFWASPSAGAREHHAAAQQQLQVASPRSPVLEGVIVQ